MNLYELYPTKQLKKLKEDKTYITENLINSLHINMPSTFGDYAVNELNFELRVYLPTINSNGTTEYTDYMGYPLTIENDEADVPITNDITEAVQIVKIMILATKDGNVIGKTNFVDKQIYDAPLKGEPLTPRKDFDEVIEQQREIIEQREQIITEQQGTITEQGEQITELNGEVTELTTENTNLSNQNETYRQTIQTFINNPPEPKLEIPEIVTPSGIAQQITPDTEQGYVGLTSCTVDRVTAEGVGFNKDYYKEGEACLGEVGTYNPMTNLADFINGIQSIVNIPEGTTTIANPNLLNSDIIIFPKSINNISDRLFYNNNKIKSVIFEEPSQLATISQLAFASSTIQSVLLPRGLNSIFLQAFRDCDFLKTIFFPKSLANINSAAFVFDSALEFVTLENGFNCNNLNLSASTLYSVETILSWFNALADRTGLTAYTLTIGATNLAKMSAEEIAIATNKNWNLA